MSQFVTLIRYTQQGAAKIKESPARLDAAQKAAEKAGGKVHAWYLTMGKYDAVIISEFPTDEASAKFMLATGALGNGDHSNHESFYRRGISQNRRFSLSVKQREGRCILGGSTAFFYDAQSWEQEWLSRERNVTQSTGYPLRNCAGR